MAWLWLLLAGSMEICWSVGMKYSQGFTRLWPTVFTFATMGVSVVGLALAMRSLPLGTAYAIWTGIGIIGSSVAGIWLFGESVSPVRLICLAFILIGIIGLRLQFK